ncbi:flavin reductase family protein [Sphingomonas sp. GB1N7]|uniref:flavin reductase family protein n=1 Tax=Parasphingomonas caseinilytica TaxID=3096158 RepID=UPI002FC7AF20
MNMTVVGLQDEFKQAMRRLAATVAIVTSGEGDGWNGMAATAVSSVTADPPTIMVAVNRSGSMSAVMLERQQFCVNLLSQRHGHLVETFAGKTKGLARFDVGDWTASDEGLPVLSDALSSLICVGVGMQQVGTHTVFFGEVTRVMNHRTIDPLLWVDGCLASISKVVGTVR